MSNQPDFLNIETISAIDKLDLSIMQKHHLRILAHCLDTLKMISEDNISSDREENLLREWCDTKSERFEDKKFSELFYKQLESTFRKLNTFSQKIGKNINDLDIKDLVILVQQS